MSKLEERSQQLSILRGQVERGAPQGQAGGNITFWGCMVVGLILSESLSWKEAGSTCSKISRKCFGDAGEIRTFRICLSCSGEAIPSLGSYGHPNICRRPCILLMRGACQKGADCGFCHLAHDAWRNFSLCRHCCLQKLSRGLGTFNLGHFGCNGLFPKIARLLGFLLQV